MAMTAWSANVSSSAICCSVNGRTSTAAHDERADAVASRSSGTTTVVRAAEDAVELAASGNSSR